MSTVEVPRQGQLSACGRACRGPSGRPFRARETAHTRLPAGEIAARRDTIALVGGKHHDHGAACLGFDHVFDAGGAARQLRAAIDEVALAARADPPGDAGPEELAERLAGLWAMMAELDPDLAARLRGYYPDTR